MRTSDSYNCTDTHHVANFFNCFLFFVFLSENDVLVASGAGSIFRLGGGTPDICGIVHDIEKPRVPPNLVFSPVLCHLFFIF